MPIDARYLDRKFEEYARDVFGRHAEPEVFDEFLRALESDQDEKAAFLRAAGFYKYLVKDLRFTLPSGDPVPPYIETTQKFLSVVSLVEGIESRDASPRERFLCFCRRLDEACQRRLHTAVEIRGQSLSVDEIAGYLYSLRSDFVHEGSLVLEVSEAAVMSSRRIQKGGSEVRVITKLPEAMLQEMFEHGVLKRFGFTGELRHDRSRDS